MEKKVGKNKIIFGFITVLILLIVAYLFNKNYIPEYATKVVPIADKKVVREYKQSDELHIDHVIPEHKYVKKKELKPNEVDMTVVQSQERRLFDDLMVATETFSPILIPFITYFLYTRKQKKYGKQKNDD